MKEFPFDHERLVEVCSQNDVAMLGALASVTDWEDEDSDLDLYVRFAENKIKASAITAITLERQLKTVFDRTVQLLTEDSLTPHMRLRVLKDVEVLYED